MNYSLRHLGLLFLCIYFTANSYSQDSIVLLKYQENFLSSYIKFDKLKNVKCIKQIENLSNHRTIEPNLIISFSKNSKIANFLIVYRDSTFKAVFNHNWSNENSLDIKKMEIYHEDFLENNVLLFKKDTSYHSERIIWKKDTVMNISFNGGYHKTNTNDTSFWIYHNNQLIKEVRIKYNLQSYVCTKTQNVCEYFYNNLGKVCKTVCYTQKSFPCDSIHIDKEYFILEPYTTFFEYDIKGNKLNEKTEFSDFERISLCKLLKSQNTTIQIDTYDIDKKHKKKRHCFSSVIEYNDKGLPIRQFEYSVERFLGFGIKKIHAKRTFEYAYWE